VRLSKGSARRLEQGLKEADVVVEGEYRIAPVEHAYIEPEAVLVEPTDDGLLVHSSTKSVHLDQAEICRVLDWPAASVQVVAPVIAGASAVNRTSPSTSWRPFLRPHQQARYDGVHRRKASRCRPSATAA